MNTVFATLSVMFAILSLEMRGGPSASVNSFIYRLVAGFLAGLAVFR